MDELREKALNRLDELRKNRDAFLAQANAEMAGYNTAIAELEKLLADDEPARVVETE